MTMAMILIVLIALALSAFAMLVTHHFKSKKHETTIRQLKTKARLEIQQACEAAKRGDPCAALKLEALKETLTEQSVRLTGHQKPPSTVILPPDSPLNPLNK